MADEFKNAETSMGENDQPDLLTLEDEDGKECTLEVIDAAEFGGQRYLAVVPYAETEEEIEEDITLIIVRQGEDEAGVYFDIVDDDDELHDVAKMFQERLEESFIIDDEDTEN